MQSRPALHTIFLSLYTNWVACTAIKMNYLINGELSDIHVSVGSYPGSGVQQEYQGECIPLTVVIGVNNHVIKMTYQVLPIAFAAIEPDIMVIQL